MGVRCDRLEVSSTGIFAEKVVETRHKFSCRLVGMKDLNATKGKDSLDQPPVLPSSRLSIRIPPGVGGAHPAIRVGIAD